MEFFNVMSNIGLGISFYGELRHRLKDQVSFK